MAIEKYDYADIIHYQKISFSLDIKRVRCYILLIIYGIYYNTRRS